MKNILIAILLFGSAAFAQPPQDKTVTVFGAKIRYVEAGDPAKPTVVLLHGLGGSVDTSWPLTIPALAANYHVIAPDLIGFGKSDKPNINYRVAFYPDFLDKFFSELKIEKAHVIGNSMGGWIAVLFTTKYPARVQKLVLVDPAGYAPPPNFDYGALAVNMNPSTRDGVRATVKLLFYNSAAFSSDAAVDNFITSRVLTNDGNTIQTLVRNLQFANDYLDEQVKTVKNPTLLIWGKQDGFVPPILADRMNKEIAGSELVLIDKAGHYPQIEQYTEFNKRVLDFLAK